MLIFLLFMVSPSRCNSVSLASVFQCWAIISRGELLFNSQIRNTKTSQSNLNRLIEHDFIAKTGM